MLLFHLVAHVAFHSLHSNSSRVLSIRTLRQVRLSCLSADSTCCTGEDKNKLSLSVTLSWPLWLSEDRSCFVVSAHVICSGISRPNYAQIDGYLSVDISGDCSAKLPRQTLSRTRGSAGVSQRGGRRGRKPRRGSRAEDSLTVAAAGAGCLLSEGSKTPASFEAALLDSLQAQS